eukprot:TRINITY_DN8170_c0_g1_i1.p1 TRINITY_DN8170_c0_g1~~TRINITY_DN8170_c0_g1_i1.p1  ORF type:complete len:347 (+),score=87.13 TRINITY_DN8170_c0_g1_i1:126-1166(+)
MLWLWALVIVLLLGILLKPVAGVTNPRTPTPDPAPVDWEGLVNTNAPATGVQYLVVGAGFLGKRIIHSLLMRGETKITAFDCDPRVAAFYKDEKRVTVIAGDVTKPEEVDEACKGVHTVYSTFAVIKYMERLPHQAAFSERINVGGTVNVCEAALKAGVKHLLYTSSSNVALPRHLKTSDNAPTVLDETSELVTRDNSPNHYGWTKAVAETTALEFNGRSSAGRAPLRVVVLRPCSGIFGHGDRFLTQKPMEDGFILGIKPLIKLDYVYVDNVAYGHLLAEAALTRDSSKVAGQVFNLTNQDPMHSDEVNITLCLLYTSDAADEEDSVDLGGCRIIKKKKKKKKHR